MTTKTIKRVTLGCAAAALLSLGGCAQLIPQPTSEVTLETGAAREEIKTQSQPSAPVIIRTSRARLAGEEIDLRPKVVASPPLPGVSEYGQRGALAPSESSGQAQTLREAARSIIPSDYVVRPAACVAQQAPASWARANNWLQALEQVMLTHGLIASVDHDLKQVLIDKPPALDPNLPRDWAVLRSDVTLRRALERWLTPACVQMEWDVPFPLDIRADRVYRGVDLWTALRSLAKELEASDTPIQIIQHPNVVRIASGQLR